MAFKVVVVDSGRLPAGVDFPPLEADKYGWEQYPALSAVDIAERCWRADIVVSLSSAIDRPILEKTHKLKLLIAVGAACKLLDEAAARDHGVELLAFPDASYRTAADAQELCNRITAAINHFVRNFHP